MATSSPKNKTLPTCHIVTCHLNESDAESIVQPILTAHPQLVLHQQRHAQELAATIHQILHSDNNRLLVLLVGAPPDKQQYEELLVHFEKQQSSLSSTFTCVLDPQRSADPRLRLQLSDAGVNMVTGDVRSVSRVLKEVCSYLTSREVAIKSKGKYYSCPECGLSHLTEDDLWRHFPLYHINSTNEIKSCPFCNSYQKNPGQHIHELHGPPGRGELQSDLKLPKSYYHGFAMVIIQRKRDNKFLVVQEFSSLGFWMPGGAVDGGETFQQAAIREVKEEVGIDVILVGVLGTRHGWGRSSDKVFRMEVYFFARPTDEFEIEPPKTNPDFESAGACWVTYEELSGVRLRAISVQTWIKYVLDKRPVYPLSILDSYIEL